MHANPKRNRLITLAILGATLPGVPALAGDTGTRVTIRVPTGALPDPQKIVEALEVAGGEHQVRATVEKAQAEEVLTLELWGNWMLGQGIPQALRDSFSVLSSADIQVASLDASSRPKLEIPDDAEVTRDANGKKTIIRKIQRRP
jgi:hypothetical protein